MTDPLVFFKTVKVEDSAHGRLDDVINGAVRNKISNHPLIEAVRTSDRPMSMMTGIDGEATGEVLKVEAGRDRIVEEVLAEAIRTYAEAYSKDPEFYSFLETLRLWRASRFGLVHRWHEDRTTTGSSASCT